VLQFVIGECNILCFTIIYIYVVITSFVGMKLVTNYYADNDYVSTGGIE
jgi:hypothetical protein